MESVEAILEKLLSELGVAHASIEHTTIAGQEIFSIQVEGDARALIGIRGETVHALDTLVKKIYEKSLPTADATDMALSAQIGERTPMFLIDVNNYRTNQIKELQTKAHMMAERARSFQYDVELSPMSSYERLIIHTTLQGAPNVKTESQGEGRNRRVVIKYSA